MQSIKVGVARVIRHADSKLDVGVARVGCIDLRAQAQVTSALRTATPRPI
jgi:hypothetical protein